MTQSIGFIGGGNIAEAMISGLKQSNSSLEIRVTNLSNRGRLQGLVDRYNVIAAPLMELVEDSRVLIIAVKPKDVQAVLKDLKDFSLKDKLVISVAAGVPLKVFYKYLPGVAVVRAMPNTSTAVLHSMTGLVRGDNVTEEQAEIGEKIFSATGRIMWVPEKNINALTAISGSGPAYFYLFAESLIKAGVELGLSEEEAEILVLETLIGSGKMIAESDKSPGKLREEVTSPNGTTYAALNVFTDEKLAETVLNAAKACARRAEDLEGEYSE
ncbi:MULTISPECIES: pyrroline-5-carboxylate reductase [Desulfosporosinus]|uniref:Pyrroline-5-carboxylate reductase n=1 Tax=Desulfosporosinus nitroreducens TaxID=2018668 RepID=A0ABT8QZ65_9FIRM|nr:MULTISPECIES: pyrroline-5-carboxylate reductase [Desulfosporosinus]MCO1603536.1 pyrroline-5-carboxylate reductase [Desulfosporosinus nitroreducens]MCO5387130.1 pyrroline-5-carboxylate reductase [Desulfosporosinus sp.]MDA8222008.1 pyrroline-5-carboxylate reductase [Desulfitobacterium hafniense]MDO0825930.1 pyrroline-5-carboxylate reductase [Desulfosporosinus nitroreducens]